MLREVITPLFSAEEVNHRLDEVAKQIIEDYRGKTIYMVGTLKGAVVVMTQLALKLENNVCLDFIRIGSYEGETTESTGSVKLYHGLSESMKGKDVLLVEDIVDTGNSLVFLREYIETQNPASLKVFTLLDKPARRTNYTAKYDYHGFVIEDKFIIGYGLDYNQRYRNLPYIGILQLED